VEKPKPGLLSSVFSSPKADPVKGSRFLQPQQPPRLRARDLRNIARIKQLEGENSRELSSAVRMGQGNLSIEDVAAPVNPGVTIGSMAGMYKEYAERQDSPSSQRKLDQMEALLSTRVADPAMREKLQELRAYREGRSQGKEVEFPQFDEEVANLPTLNDDPKGLEAAGWLMGETRPMYSDQGMRLPRKELYNPITGEARPMPYIGFVNPVHLRYMMGGLPTEGTLIPQGFHVLAREASQWIGSESDKDFYQRARGFDSPYGRFSFVPDLRTGSVEGDIEMLQKPEVMRELMDRTGAPGYGEMGLRGLTNIADFVGVMNGLGLAFKGVGAASSATGLTQALRGSRALGGLRSLAAGPGRNLATAFTRLPLARRTGAIATGLNFDPRQVGEEVVYQVLNEMILNPADVSLMERVDRGFRQGLSEGVAELLFGAAVRGTGAVSGAGMRKLARAMEDGGHSRFTDQLERLGMVLRGDSAASITEHMRNKFLYHAARGQGRYGAEIAKLRSKGVDTGRALETANVAGDELLRRGMRDGATDALESVREDVFRRVFADAKELGQGSGKLAMGAQFAEMMSNALGLGIAFGAYSQAESLARRDGVKLDGWNKPLETLKYLNQVDLSSPEILGSAVGMALLPMTMVGHNTAFGADAAAYRERMRSQISALTSDSAKLYIGKVNEVAQGIYASGHMSKKDLDALFEVISSSEANEFSSLDIDQIAEADLEDLDELWNYNAGEQMVGLEAPDFASTMRNQVLISLYAQTTPNLYRLRRRIRESPEKSQSLRGVSAEIAREISRRRKLLDEEYDAEGLNVSNRPLEAAAGQKVVERMLYYRKLIESRRASMRSEAVDVRERLQEQLLREAIDRVQEASRRATEAPAQQPAPKAQPSASNKAPAAAPSSKDGIARARRVSPVAFETMREAERIIGSGRRRSRGLTERLRYAMGSASDRVGRRRGQVAAEKVRRAQEAVREYRLELGELVRIDRAIEADPENARLQAAREAYVESLAEKSEGVIRSALDAEFEVLRAEQSTIGRRTPKEMRTPEPGEPKVPNEEGSYSGNWARTMTTERLESVLGDLSMRHEAIVLTGREKKGELNEVRSEILTGARELIRRLLELPGLGRDPQLTELMSRKLDSREARERAVVQWAVRRGRPADPERIAYESSLLENPEEGVGYRERVEQIRSVLDKATEEDMGPYHAPASQRFGGGAVRVRGRRAYVVPAGKRWVIQGPNGEFLANTRNRTYETRAEALRDAIALTDPFQDRPGWVPRDRPRTALEAPVDAATLSNSISGEAKAPGEPMAEPGEDAIADPGEAEARAAQATTDYEQKVIELLDELSSLSPKANALASTILERIRFLQGEAREELIDRLERQVQKYRDRLGVDAWVEVMKSHFRSQEQVDSDLEAQKARTLDFLSEVEGVDAEGYRYAMDTLNRWARATTSDPTAAASGLAAFLGMASMRGDEFRRGVAAAIIVSHGLSGSAMKAAVAMTGLEPRTVKSIQDRLVRRLEDYRPEVERRMAAFENDIYRETGVRVKFRTETVEKAGARSGSNISMNTKLSLLASGIETVDGSVLAAGDRSVSGVVKLIEKGLDSETFITALDSVLRGSLMNFDIEGESPISPESTGEEIVSAMRAARSHAIDALEKLAGDLKKLGKVKLRPYTPGALVTQGRKSVVIDGVVHPLGEFTDDDTLPKIGVKKSDLAYGLIAAISGRSDLLIAASGEKAVEAPASAVTRSGDSARKEVEDEEAFEEAEPEEAAPEFGTVDGRDFEEQARESSVRIQRIDFEEGDRINMSGMEMLLSGGRSIGYLRELLFPRSAEAASAEGSKLEGYDRMDSEAAGAMETILRVMRMSVDPDAQSEFVALWSGMRKLNGEPAFASEAEAEAALESFQTGVLRYRRGAELLALSIAEERAPNLEPLLRAAFRWLQAKREGSLDLAAASTLIQHPFLRVVGEDGEPTVDPASVRKFVERFIEKAMGTEGLKNLGVVTGMDGVMYSQMGSGLSVPSFLRSFMQKFKSRRMARDLAVHIATDVVDTLAYGSISSEWPARSRAPMRFWERSLAGAFNFGMDRVANAAYARLRKDKGQTSREARLKGFKNELRALRQARRDGEGLKQALAFAARSIIRPIGHFMGKDYETADGSGQWLVSQIEASQNLAFDQATNRSRAISSELSKGVEEAEAAMAMSDMTADEGVVAGALIDLNMLPRFTDPADLVEATGLKLERAQVVLHMAHKLAEVGNQVARSLVDVGALHRQQYEAMRSRWCPIVKHRSQAQKKQAPTYAEEVELISMIPDGNTISRMSDFDSVQADRVMDARKVMPARLMAETMSYQRWAHLHALSESGAMITREEYLGLVTPGSPTYDPGYASYFKKASISSRPAAKPGEVDIDAEARHAKEIAIHGKGDRDQNFMHEFVRQMRAEHESESEMQARVIDGKATHGKKLLTKRKRELFDMLENGYVMEMAHQNVSFSLIQTDRAFSRIDEIYQVWRRNKTIMSPRFWLTNLVSGMLSNILTGRVSVKDTLLTGAGLGPYARAAEMMNEYYGAIQSGLVEVDTFTGEFKFDENLAPEQRERYEIVAGLINILGQGTWRKTVAGMGALLSRQEVLGGVGLGTAQEGAAADMFADSVDAMSGRKAQGFRSLQQGMWKALTGGDAAERAAAYQDFMEAHQAQELWMKLGAALKALEVMPAKMYDGTPIPLQERIYRAAHHAFPGTVNYGAASQMVKRWSQGASFFRSRIEKTVLENRKGRPLKARDNLGHAAAVGVFGHPFLAYSAGVIPTMAASFINRPVYSMLNAFLVSGIASMMFLPDEDDAQKLESDMAGRPGFGHMRKSQRRVINPSLDEDDEVLDILEKESGNMVISYGHVADGTGLLNGGRMLVGDMIKSFRNAFKYGPFHRYQGIGEHDLIRSMGRNSYVDFRRYMDLLSFPSMLSGSIRNAYRAAVDQKFDMVIDGDGLLGPLPALGLAAIHQTQQVIRGVSEDDYALLARTGKAFSSEWVAALGPLAVLNSQHGMRALEELHNTKIEDVMDGVYHSSAVERSSEQRVASALAVALIPVRTTSPTRVSNNATLGEAAIKSIEKSVLAKSGLRRSGRLEKEMASNMTEATVKTIQSTVRNIYQKVLETEGSEIGPDAAQLVDMHIGAFADDVHQVFQVVDGKEVPVMTLKPNPKSDLGKMLKRVKRDDPLLHDLQILFISNVLESSNFERARKVFQEVARHRVLGPGEVEGMWRALMSRSGTETIDYIEDRLTAEVWQRQPLIMSAAYDMLIDLQRGASEEDRASIRRLMDEHFGFYQNDPHFDSVSDEFKSKAARGRSILSMEPDAQINFPEMMRDVRPAPKPGALQRALENSK